MDGQKIQVPFTAAKDVQGKVAFESYVREWKIGAQIDVNSLDCQAIALSFSLLGQQLQADFEREMNVVLGLPIPKAP